MAENLSQELLLLGRIDGTVQAMKTQQNDHGELLQSLDERLRKVETKAAVNGAVAGGVMTIGMMLLAETVKGWLGVGGPKT